MHSSEPVDEKTKEKPTWCEEEKCMTRFKMKIYSQPFPCCGLACRVPAIRPARLHAFLRNLPLCRLSCSSAGEEVEARGGKATVCIAKKGIKIALETLE